MNSHLDFDLDLAKDQSDKNPIFYLQYAHARICNIIKHGENQDFQFSDNFDPSLLNEENELKLMKLAKTFVFSTWHKSIQLELVNKSSSVLHLQFLVYDPKPLLFHKSYKQNYHYH